MLKEYYFRRNTNEIQLQKIGVVNFLETVSILGAGALRQSSFDVKQNQPSVLAPKYFQF